MSAFVQNLIAIPSDYAFGGSVTSWPGGSGTGPLPAMSIRSGDSVFVYVSHASNPTTLNLTDSAGNTYIPLSWQNINGGSCWFYCLNATPYMNNVITINRTGTSVSYLSGTALRFTGGRYRALDTEVSTFNNSPVLTCTSPSFSTTSAGIILAGAFCSSGNWYSNNGMTLNNGITLVSDATGFVTCGYKITTSAQIGQTITNTGTSIGQRMINVAAFK